MSLSLELKNDSLRKSTSGSLQDLSVENDQRNLSLQNVSNVVQPECIKKAFSAPQLQHLLIGSEKIIPIFERLEPSLCTWTLIDQEKIKIIKQHQNDKEMVLSLFGNEVEKSIIPMKDRNKRIVSFLLWEVFKFSRDQLFSEKAVSASLGLFFLTHQFFLAQIHRTAKETYSFFYETLLMHSVMDPPKCDQVFSPNQCILLLELFGKIYLQQLPLIHIACQPINEFIIDL